MSCVLVGPRNLRTLFTKEPNEGGILTSSDNQLECLADGNPTPRYEWTIETKHSNITVHNSVLHVNESMFSDQQLTVKCKAINDVGEQIAGIVINRPTVSVTGKSVHMFNLLLNCW